MDNVSRVVEKVEPKHRQEVLKHMIRYPDVTAAIENKFSDISEREAAYVDIYVTCQHSSSWEEIAGSLFKYRQMTVVDEMKSYLPPKGDPSLCGVCICCTRNFFIHIIISVSFRGGEGAQGSPP